MREARYALIGQCRGDLPLLLRQLSAVRIDATPTDAHGGYTLVDRRPANAEPVVILGDVIGPRNAWASTPASVGSNDLAILRLVMAVCTTLRNVSALAGLHELLLFNGHTGRCGHGANHRRLLAHVLTDEFERAWGAITRGVPRAVRRAGTSIDAILLDNDARAPPPGLEAQWPLLSTYDRGTRFLVGDADAPHTGLASAAFDADPAALAWHFASEYARTRTADGPPWARTAALVAAPYGAFDERRHECIAAVGGAAVADPKGTSLSDGALRDFAEHLQRHLASARPSAAAPSAPSAPSADELARVAVSALRALRRRTPERTR